MTNDPMKEIEDKQGQKDLGRMIARFYQGALEETESRFDAFWVTVAHCLSMMKSTHPEEETEEDDVEKDGLDR